MFSVRSGMMVLGLALSTMFILPLRDDRKRSFQNCAPCDSIPDNKARALLYCSSCHLFPDPSLLDKKTWVNNVLPNMGWRLGIRLKQEDPYADIIQEERAIVRQLKIYPETPLISVKDWKSIVAYYEKEAPEIPLPQQPHIVAQDTLSLFQPRQISFGDKLLPRTTMLTFNHISDEIYVGDGMPRLYILNNHFEFKSAWNVESTPVDIDFPENEPPRLLTVGSVSPSDQKKGRLVTFDTTFTLQNPPVNINALPRPVQFVDADLDLDGKQDVVICGFGNNTGKLSWYSDGKISNERVISNMPGARGVEIGDFNKDGKPDIMALMTQAWEEIVIWYNEGNGKFKEKKLLRFPPVFGASYFILTDFNKDGYPDILLTNGDNWDYSRINKNYHGIRIYLNDGKYNFSERWFYPLYGTSKAIAADFDKDGDLDIAAIAFYNTLDNPANGFVYFSDQGNFNFIPASIPEAALGKWLTMEAGDFDHDGDIDIVLGSYFHNMEEMRSFISASGVATFPQLLVLTNNTKRKHDR